MTTTTTSDNPKLARFRQLVAEKRLQRNGDEGSTPMSRSSRGDGDVASIFAGDKRTDGGARTKPIIADDDGRPFDPKWGTRPASTHDGVDDDDRRGVTSENRMDEMVEQAAMHRENRNPNQISGDGGNNSSNLVAMKKIVARKRMMAQVAREMSPSTTTTTTPSETPRSGMTTFSNGITPQQSLSSVSKMETAEDCNDWTMLGNHLEENTTMDHEESSTIAGSPDFFPGEMSSHHFDWKQQTTPSNCGTPIGIEDGGGLNASGLAGMLSFLGDSPAFDRDNTAVPPNTPMVEENEVERNLRCSTEKVRRLESRLLRTTVECSGETMMSPVIPTPRALEEDQNRRNVLTRQGSRVSFAKGDGWETPSHERSGVGNTPSNAARRQYPKSPYQFTSDETGMTNVSMEAVANPMNESVIVSDDEASGDDLLGEPSPLKDIGRGDINDRDNDDEFNRFEGGQIVDFDMTGSSVIAGSGGDKGSTPSRAALMERNYTLVKEVRFADQSCVALAERKKYYKSQLCEYKKILHATNEENALLRTKCQSSLRENDQLKVLVESLQSQKQKAESQVDAYRMQISDSEKTHRSILKTMEKTYQSQLNNVELQINSLTERLQDSLATNISLQSKLDDVHDKWESKLQSDVASRELIASLKERITSGESTSTNAHASMKTLQTRIADLQTLCDHQKNQLQMERSEREMTEQDRDDLQAQCNDLHGQLTKWAQSSDALEDIFFDKDGSHNEDFVDALRDYTPVKKPRSSSIDDGSSDFGSLRTPSGRTPTANLLARTLRSELQRRQTMSEKLTHVEDQVTRLKLDISDMKMVCEEAKAENILLKEELDEKDAHLEAKDDHIARLTEEIEVRSWEGGEGGELDERDAHITQLNLLIGAKDDQIARLTEEIEIQNWAGCGASTEQSVSESESQCKSQFQREHDSVSVLEERLDALEGTLEVTDEELKETKARLVDTQEMLDQTGGELERSEEDLAAAHHQLSDYEAQVDKLFKDLTEKEVEYANLERFSHFQKSTIETIKDKLSHSEKIGTELHTQLESCFQSLMALEKILKTYEDLDGVAGQIIAQQSRKVSRLLETMAQMSPRNTSITPREFGPRAEVDFDSPSKIEMELDVVNKQYDELNTLLSNVTLENGRLKAKLAESNEQLQNANKLLKWYQENFNEQENGQIRDIETRFNMELNVANKELQQANKLLEEYQNELCNQEGEHSEEIIFLKQQRDELEAKLSTVISETKTAESTLSQQLSVMRSNNTDLMKENESLRLTLQSFELQLEDEKSLLRATRAAADGYRLDVTNAKAAFEIITTEKDMIKNTLTKVEKQAHDLQQLVNEKEKVLKDSRESLSKVQVTLKEQTESMKAQCKDLETRLSVEESSRLSAEASLDDAYVHIAKLEEIMKMNEKDLEVKDSECFQLIIQVKEIQSALAEAERERSDAELTIERLENELHDKQSTIFAYEESIISYKGDIRGLENTLQSTIHEKNSRIEMLEQACNSRQALFSEQLDRTQKERDASTAELTDMINRLQHELFESNRLYQESGDRTKSTMSDMSNAYQLLEVEILRKQAQLDEVTQKFDNSCVELRQAHHEICRITDMMSSVEMDCEIMGSRHQDEVNDLVEQRNQMHEERVQLEEQILSLQDKLSVVSQHRDEIAELSAQNDSLHKKCEMLKNVIKALNENNKAWETSYNQQTDDLVLHAKESSRLNEQVTVLKRVLNSSEQSVLRTRQLHLKVDSADPSWSLEGPRTDNVRTQPFGDADDNRFMDPKWGMRPTSAL